MKKSYLLSLFLLNVVLVLKLQAQEYVTDDTFITGSTAFNANVWDIHLQDDGKIVAMGAFTSYNTTTANRLIRLNSNGSVDNPYLTNLGAGFASGFIYRHLSTDNSLILIGSFPKGIARIGSDGTPDNSFNTNIGDGVSSGQFVYGIVKQTDGKFVLGGNFSNWQGASNPYMIRLNPNGSKDATYLATGQFNSHVRAVAAQTDGKLMVGGLYTQYGSSALGRIARLNADGSLDESFNTAGSGFNNSVLGITIQTDGKILIIGQFTKYNDIDVSAKLVRLNADGSLDESFNAGGAGFDTGTAHPQTAFVQADGKIIIRGQFTSYNGVLYNNIIRLNTNGSIDNTFNIGAGFNNGVWTSVMQPDGKLLVGGSFTTKANRIVRLVDESTLPIDLISFTAIPGMNEIVLSWRTASEKNNEIFIVEKSLDAITWTETGKLNGSGTRDNENNYYIKDKAPSTGLSYYRLSQRDTDGKITMFDPVAVNYILSPSEKFTVYPNPAINNINLNLPVENARIIITDLTGRIVYESQYLNNNSKINISTLKNGIYTVSAIVLDNKTYSQKLIIQ